MLLYTLLLTAIISASPRPAEPADLVIENARIWSDGRAGFASFAAVRDGVFVYVGRADAEPGLIDRDTRRIDARGSIVLPGLIDTHVHMLSGGLGMNELQLRDAASRAEFVKRIAEWAEKLPPDAWVRGGRWSTESWEDPEQPTKEWIDPVTGNRPVYLPRMDGHSALVNSAALERAGITADSPPDPEGGVIDRDPNSREPTGILRESAMALVAGLIPPETTASKVAALEAAMREANRHGITAVADIPGLDDLETYERLADSGVTVRLFLYPTASEWASAVEVVDRFQGRPLQVQVNGLKTYLDGSLGSRTAYMRDPFLGNEPSREEWRGLLREDVEGGKLKRNITAARDAGLQPIAHAIGDAANHLLLETLAEVYGEALRSARARSEHAQHLLPEDIQRFGDLGVIASMQPYHKADDGRYAESYIGAERSRSSYAFKSLLDAGAVVAFGSDWPVVSIDPFLGVEAAVTGQTLDDRYWQTQENITVQEALRCYTSRAAYALFAEESLGRIAPGYRADFVILAASPFNTEVDWSAIRPAAVFVDGELVWEPAE